jgi:hypothetical protein
MQHVVDIQAELDSFLTELIWPGPPGDELWVVASFLDFFEWFENIIMVIF